MKKSLFKLIAISFLLSFAAVSCASLQEDVLITSETETHVASETEDFEKSFREFDSALLSGKEVSSREMDKYCSGIEKKISSHAEPALTARLQALEGLVQVLGNKNKKAAELYSSAKALQSGDECVLLLNVRLQENIETSLSVINEYLSFDSENPLFVLEKGILLYKKGDYSGAVAGFDDAFLLFDRQSKPLYREKYTPIRDAAWKFYSMGVETSENISFSEKNLTCEKMVGLTRESTKLLESFTLDSNVSNKELVKKLEKAGYFSAAVDAKGESFSSQEITGAKELTRILCARFLWNLYVKEKGNPKLLTAYSTRYAKLKNPVSPVEDLPLQSPDFDACLGVVEKEIMNLTDGKLFEGEKVVSELEFIEFVKNCQKVLE